MKLVVAVGGLLLCSLAHAQKPEPKPGMDKLLDKLTFTKEAEGAMVPMLMERYGAAAGAPTLVNRAARPIAKSKEFTATPGNETK